MSLEKVIESFCSRAIPNREQSENVEILVNANCSRCSQSSRKDSCVVFKTATCNACEHFTPNLIGDGNRVGHCFDENTWTEEKRGLIPLYRCVDGHCRNYSRLIT